MINTIVLFASAFHQQQNSFFGTVKYNAQQTNFYGNLQYELTYAKHELKTGISYRHLKLNEDVAFTDIIY
jgi:outer membrane receptor for ferrienterochelin and colicins